MRYLLFCYLMISYSWICAQHFETVALDTLLENVRSDDAGIIVGVIKEGELIFTQSKGLANLKATTPITSNSNFRLSSTTKQFTAASIMHLRQRGILSLSDPLSKYFPMYASKLGSVTIQHLLNHTSGIRDYMSLLMVKGSEHMDMFNSFTGTNLELDRLLSTQKELAFETGEMHSYSNTNYWLLSQVVLKASGLSLGAYARKHIFEPLGMNNTRYIEDYKKDMPNKVIGYVSPCAACEREPYKYQTTAVGDGGLISNINELLLWEEEYYNQEILDSLSWSLMAQQGVLNNGEKISYACGLIIDNYKGYDLIKHSGSNPGFSSQILKFPSEHLSVIVLGNQNWHDVRKYAKDVADQFLDIEVTAPTTPSDIKLHPKVLSPQDIERFCGDYIYKETGEIRTIKNTPDGLLYLRGNGPTSNLITLSPTSLTYSERPHVRMTFIFRPDGTKQINWTDGNRTLIADTYEPVKESVALLSEYRGTYYSDELLTEIQIKQDSADLTLNVAGQTMLLQLVSKDKLSAMGMFKIKIERNEENLITGLRLDVPRAENIAFEFKSK